VGSNDVSEVNANEGGSRLTWTFFLTKIIFMPESPNSCSFSRYSSLYIRIFLASSWQVTGISSVKGFIFTV
jgi:hypothetical protein